MGGGTSGTFGTRCTTKSFAISVGCAVGSTYTDNQLVRYSHLSKNNTTYNISLDFDLSRGSLSVSPTSAKSGTTITVTCAPSGGYYTSALYYKVGNAKYSITNGTFIMPASNCTVCAIFEVYVAPPNPKKVYYATRDSDWNYCIGCCDNFIGTGGEPNDGDEDLFPYIPDNYSTNTCGDSITDIVPSDSVEYITHVFFQNPGGDSIDFTGSHSFLHDNSCKRLVACGLRGCYLSSPSSEYDISCLSHYVSDMFDCQYAIETFQYIEFANGFAPVFHNTVYNFFYATLPNTGISDPNSEFKDYIDRENNDDLCLFMISHNSNNSTITSATPYTYAFVNNVPIVFIDGVSPNGSNTLIQTGVPESSSQANDDNVHNFTWTADSYYSYNGVQNEIITPEYASLEALLDPIVRHNDILRLITPSADIGSDLDDSNCIIFSLGTEQGAYNLPSTYGYRFWLLGFGSGEEDVPKLKLSLVADAYHAILSSDISEGAVDYFDTYYDCIMQYNNMNYLVFYPSYLSAPTQYSNEGKEFSCNGAIYDNSGSVISTDFAGVRDMVYNPTDIYYWSLYCEVVGQDSNIPAPADISTVFRIDCERYFNASLCHIVWQHEYNTFRYG